jgi:BolA protein
MAAIAETMRKKLEAALSPQRLEIVDDSESHRGHGGYREGGESHFNMEIVADSFADASRVARQRMVFDVLSDELAGPVHALSLRCLAPGEDG